MQVTRALLEGDGVFKTPQVFSPAAAAVFGTPFPMTFSTFSENSSKECQVH